MQTLHWILQLTGRRTDRDTDATPNLTVSHNSLKTTIFKCVGDVCFQETCYCPETVNYQLTNCD